MFERNQFPDDFIFGTATSAYQIEGHGFGGAGRTHWDDFAQTPGNVVRQENGYQACDHYHRFSEDVDLIADAHFDAYRFSASWARILPDGVGQVNMEGLDFYDRLVDKLLERNIKPSLTLYHWELPSVLSDLGGWRNRDIASWFADYTEILLGRLGDRIWSVAPINEPWCVSWLSHFLGHHAPGMRDIRATARAMHHVLLAHGRSVQVMRGMGQSNVGAIFNMEWAEPFDQSEKNIHAAKLYDAYYNRFFIDGIFRQQYPEVLLQGIEAHLPKNWQDDFDVIGQKVDWCGLNYYTRKIIKSDDSAWPHHHEAEGPLPKTQMGWEIYPEGLYKFLTRMRDEYSANMPIYVTENGMANDDMVAAGGVHDQARIDYLDAHLQMVHKAIDEGVPVKGYYTWSLLDNYEWALGFEKRFGLVHVDFDTFERTPKSSYHWLSGKLAR